MATLDSWDGSWNVGNESVDAEHRKLFGMLKVLRDACDLGFGGSVLSSILAELADYCRLHFSHEESLLQKIGYPLLQEHQKIHQKLRQQVADLREKVASSTDREALTIELGLFLQEWLIQHILQEDHRYKIYLSNC